MAKKPCTFKGALLAGNRDRILSEVGDPSQVRAIRRNVPPTLAPEEAVLGTVEPVTARGLRFMGDPAIAASMIAAIDGRRVMLWSEGKKGESFPVRAVATGWEEGKPVKTTFTIATPTDMAQRLRKQKPREILYEIADESDNTRELVIDLDPQPAFGFEKTKGAALDIARRFSTWSKATGVRTYFSGGKGFHLHVDLKKAIHIDEGRLALQERLSTLVTKAKGVWTHSTQKKTPDQLLVDILVNKKRGPIRAPFSPHQKTGLIKVPIDSEEALLKFDKIQATTERAMLKLGALREEQETFLGGVLEEALDEFDVEAAIFKTTAIPSGLVPSWFKAEVSEGGYTAHFTHSYLSGVAGTDSLLTELAVLQMLVDSNLPLGSHFLHDGNFKPRQWLSRTTVAGMDIKNLTKGDLESIQDESSVLRSLLHKRGSP